MSNKHFLSKSIAPRLLLLAAILGLLVITPQPARSQTLTVLHSFAGYPNDGSAPDAGLIMDAQGNLYGTTIRGGVPATCPYKDGCGTVFRLTPDGTETLLHSFRAPRATSLPRRVADGIFPFDTLIMDLQGNLYGTTANGGHWSNDWGYGTVFELTRAGEEKVLYAFLGYPNDGQSPYAGLVMDAQGNLYGTTYYGGAYGQGTVFKVAPNGTETVLHSFCASSGCPDGQLPGGLIIDAQGILYGTTAGGGDYGVGTAFEMTPNGAETILHSFNGSDGDSPGDLVMDAQGNLYGPTSLGGAYDRGTVFKLTSDGVLTVLYSFPGGAAGYLPNGGLVMDAQGNLYGTTAGGGAYDGGTVFKLTSDGVETVLYSFCSKSGCTDGATPFAGLIMDAQGNHYATTIGGGISNSHCPYGCGTVFKLTP